MSLLEPAEECSVCGSLDWSRQTVPHRRTGV